MSEPIIIGIDHGNGLMKTVNAEFTTGIEVFKEAPSIVKPYMVRVGNQYFACNSGRGKLRRDKTIDESYWYLTLAGLGVELKERKILSPPRDQKDIIISAGLPLTYPQADRVAFRKYLFRKKEPIDFWFEGNHCCINIKDVMIWPQGYSATMNQINNLINVPTLIVVDIGFWTIEVFVFNYGDPDMTRLRSYELGVSRCLKEIAEQVRRNYKLSLTNEQIEAVLWPKDDIDLFMPKKVIKEIKDQTQIYVTNVISELIEDGFDVKSVPSIYIGGGGKLVEEHYDQDNLFYPSYVGNIRSNAKGYEKMAAAALAQKQGQKKAIARG